MGLTTGAASITEPLPPSQRAAFLVEAFAAEIAHYPAAARGPGLLYRLGRNLKRTFKKREVS